jgi:hypothetical protein
MEGMAVPVKVISARSVKGVPAGKVLLVMVSVSHHHASMLACPRSRCAGVLLRVCTEPVAMPMPITT